jgi:high-affinity nickel-transport protein
MFPEPLTAILLGALLGLRHATDADHLAAVTAIVARERSMLRAARVGALWGVGHTLTLLLVGGAIIAFRLVIPPRVGLALEFAVALMLIGLGYANLRGRGDRSVDRAAARPFLVGTVHGLAGSAAVALLALATIRSTLPAIAYLVVFGFGTILGMVLATVVVAAPTLHLGARGARGAQWRLRVRYAAGALSIGVGLFLAHGIIKDGGLFAAVPVWAPR